MIATAWQERYAAALKSYEEQLRRTMELVGATDATRLSELVDKPCSSERRVAIHYSVEELHRRGRAMREARTAMRDCEESVKLADTGDESV